MRYCGEAERCSSDVVHKLREWKVKEGDIEPILQQLKKEIFVDDQRFLMLYAIDKWKLNHWGKQKIINKLYEKGFEKNDIVPTLNFIDEEEYVFELSKMLEKKLKSLGKESRESKVRKLLAFAGSRGFEEEYILQWLEQKDFI